MSTTPVIVRAIITEREVFYASINILTALSTHLWPARTPCPFLASRAPPAHLRLVVSNPGLFTCNRICDDTCCGNTEPSLINSHRGRRDQGKNQKGELQKTTVRSEKKSATSSKNQEVNDETMEKVAIKENDDEFNERTPNTPSTCNSHLTVVANSLKEKKTEISSKRLSSLSSAIKPHDRNFTRTNIQRKPIPSN